MARGQQGQQTVTVSEGVPRPQIVLALGLALIVADILTSRYWQSVFGAIFGPTPAASGGPTRTPPQHTTLGG